MAFSDYRYDQVRINEEAELYWDNKGLNLDDFDPILFDKSFAENTDFLVDCDCFLRTTQQSSLTSVNFKVHDNFILVTRKVFSLY